MEEYRVINIARGKDGNPVYITEAKNGLQCECTCYECNGKMQAVQGSKRQWYFRHDSNQECKHGAETALHILSKEIVIKNLEKIMLPATISALYGIQHVEDTYKIDVTKTQTEVTIEDIRVDNIVYINNNPLIIETKVTNGIDDIKYEKIKRLGISVLEIDLSNISFITKEELEMKLMYSTNNKSWIFNKAIYDLEKPYYDILYSQIVENPNEVECGVSLGEYNGWHTYVDLRICEKCPYKKKMWKDKNNITHLECTGNFLVKELSDLNLSLEQRKKKYWYCKNIDHLKINAKICPECNEPFDLLEGGTGKFLGHRGFPHNDCKNTYDYERWLDRYNS